MSMFANAKVVKAAKAPKAGKVEVKMVGLQSLAEVDALIDALSALKTTLAAEVKSAAFEHFISVADGKRPDNFRGVEGIASASIELRKRSTTSPLGEAELALLAEHDIPAEKLVATQKMFGIDPKYTGDTALLDVVSAALEGKVPEDFIVVQEERSKTVVTDETLRVAFSKNVRDVIAAVTVLAIKPKLDETDLGRIMDDLRAVIAPVQA